MVSNARYLLQHWKQNIEDFLITKHEFVTESGVAKTGYLVSNISTKVAYNIEDALINKQLVEDMIASGVPVVSEEESRRILHPHLKFPIEVKE
jgi:hypothetical protein